MQSLLRLLEAENGRILIDDVDISRLGLHKLRNAMSVIPQSPVLYGGCSLRVNLDPFQGEFGFTVEVIRRNRRLNYVILYFSYVLLF